MAVYTTYKNLEKPLSVEKYNVGVANKNSDVIDSELHRLDLKNESQDNLLATKEALNAETARAVSKEKELAENLSVEITKHNTSDSAHNDIRNLISGLTLRLNALADSDDAALDQLSEIAAYIKNNKTLIDGITADKVNISDIIDNLASTAVNKPLSANQGKILNDLISALTAAVSNKVDKISGKGLSANDYTDAEKNKLEGIASGAEVNVQSDWNVTDTASDAYIKNKPAIPSPTAVKGNAETAYRTGNVNLTPDNIGAVNKTGDTMTGNLGINKSSGESRYQVTRTDTGTSVFCGIGAGGINHGVYSSTLGKWIAYADAGKVYLNGNADTAEKLQTARQISIADDAAGSGIFDGSSNLTINVTRRGCVVGQSASTTTNPYYKFAAFATATANADLHITFHVWTSFADLSTKLGILTAHFRTSGAGIFESGEMVWEYALSGIDINNFMMIYKATPGTNVIVELWAKCDRAYQSYHFDVISEGNRTVRGARWTLFDKVTQGSESAVTAGYTIITSKLSSIENSISGNAASATKLQTARTINGVPFDGTQNITVSDDFVNSELYMGNNYLSSIAIDSQSMTQKNVSVVNGNFAQSPSLCRFYISPGLVWGVLGDLNNDFTITKDLVASSDLIVRMNCTVPDKIAFRDIGEDGNMEISSSGVRITHNGKLVGAGSATVMDGRDNKISLYIVMSLSEDIPSGSTLFYNANYLSFIYRCS